MKKRPDLGLLQKFLLDEMRTRNLSARALSLNAGLNHSAVSDYLGGVQPSLAHCKKLADYLEVPAERIQYYAGHTTAPPDMTADVKALAALLEGLTPAERAVLVADARSMRKQIEQLRQVNQGK